MHTLIANIPSKEEYARELEEKILVQLTDKKGRAAMPLEEGAIRHDHDRWPLGVRSRDLRNFAIALNGWID